MSQWGSYEERMEEFRKEVKENNKRALALRNRKVKEKLDENVVNASWEKKSLEILKLIDEGITDTDEWYLENSNWVKFRTGDFAGHHFSVSSIITENRVSKYLLKHQINLTDKEVKELVNNLSGLTAIEAKSRLKKYIINFRTNSDPIYFTKTKEKTNKTPKRKGGLFLRLIKFIFGK